MTDIVVGFDGSDQAVRAVHWAAAEASAHSATLQVVQSWKEPWFGGPSGIGAWADAEAEVHRVGRELTTFVDRLMVDHPGVAFETSLIDAKPAAGLIEYAEGSEMLVLGPRGKGGILGLDLGSVSQRVARQSSVPVVITRGTAERDKPDVVAAVDGSECGRMALRWAAEQAALHGKRLVAVMAWNYLEPQGPHGPEKFRPDYSERDAAAALSEIVASALADGPAVSVEEHVECDLPARAVLGQADDACLIVVGRHGTARWSIPDLGTTGQQLLSSATCPVAIIPGPAIT